MTALKPLRTSWGFFSSSGTQIKADCAGESVFSNYRSWVRFLCPHKTSQLNTGISSGQHKVEQTRWVAEQHDCVVRQEGGKVLSEFFSPTPLQDSRLRNATARS